MKKGLNKIFDLGVNYSTLDTDVKKTRIVNIVTFVIHLTGLSFWPVFKLGDLHLLANLTWPTHAMFLVVFFLNKYGKTSLAKLWFLITLSTVLIIYAALCPWIRIEYFYFSCIVTAFLFFGSKEYKEKYFIVIYASLWYSIFAFGGLDFLDQNFAPVNENIIHYIMIIANITLISVCLNVLGKETESFEESLRGKIDEKEALNEEYESIIEELRQAQEEINFEKHEKELAQKEAVFKDNFLSNMSHEIRTPLNGIVGMLDILKDTEPTEEQQDYLDTIKASSNHLMAIINDVLDLSKIQAGKMELKPVEFNLQQLIHSTKRLYQGMAAEKSIELKSEYLGILPMNLKADKTKIGQILNNFVSNALKFSEKGSVTIKSEVEYDDLLKISVIDTGVGISQSDVEKLFGKFEQLDNSVTKTHKGTGLGLAISKELTKILGGFISVESEVGKGTTFSFSFRFEPIKGDIKGIINLKDKVIVEGLKVLLVEDILVNQKVGSLILKSFKCDIEIANNGQEAVDMFEEDKYDLILMDIQMPVMDGVTATQTIKSRFKKVPPIVALSANAMEGDAEKYISQGLDKYIAKPVTKKAIEETLAEYFGE